jgi:hypothetical protein
MLYIWTLLAVLYIWLLPLLAGFAVEDAHSISGFIETPGATGAMAVAVAAPFVNMLRFEQTLPTGRSRTLSMALFFAGFGGFLVFNVSDYAFAHYTSVLIFATSFCAHAVLRLRDVKSSAARALLIVGFTAFVTMAVMVAASVTSLAFWATECVGFSALLLFTPVEQRASRETSLSL